MGTESGMRYLTEARALESQGVDIVHLEIGEPHFDTPPVAVEAAARALREGATHYGPAAGLPELRQALAADVSRWSGLDLGPNNVAVVPGSKMIVLGTLLAFTEPGDEVIVFEPGFPVYAALARLVGCTVKTVPLRASDGFRPDASALARVIGPRTRVIVANWPHNPTGTVLRADDAVAIRNVVRERDVIVVSDELYRDLSFTPEAASLFATIDDPERCVLMDGFSKRWAMTGWRLGFAVASERIVAALVALTTNTTTCATTFGQLGAVAALRDGGIWQQEMLRELLRLRDVAVSVIGAAGLETVTPDGALYCFVRTGGDSRARANEFLQRGVATMPGAAFGADGEGHVRVTYSVAEDSLREGIRRMGSR
jgi:aspartate/methionine/tyrosine aminotransferase